MISNFFTAHSLMTPFFIILFIIFIVFPLNILLGGIFALYDIRDRRFYLLKKLLIADSVILAVSIAGFIISALLSNAPSAKQMQQNYFKHKAEFNSLAKRIQQDQKKGLERVDMDWTRPEDITSIGLTAQDLKTYREELQMLDIPRGFYADSNQIEFDAYVIGSAVSSDYSKEYIYSKKTLTNYYEYDCGAQKEPVDDLDSFKGCNNGYSYTIYQKIDQDWYIAEELIR